jgi:hypothetical protein
MRPILLVIAVLVAGCAELEVRLSQAPPLSAVDNVFADAISAARAPAAEQKQALPRAQRICSSRSSTRRPRASSAASSTARTD